MISEQDIHNCLNLTYSVNSQFCKEEHIPRSTAKKDFLLCSISLTSSLVLEGYKHTLVKLYTMRTLCYPNFTCSISLLSNH